MMSWSCESSSNSGYINITEVQIVSEARNDLRTHDTLYITVHFADFLLLNLLNRYIF